MTTEEQIAVMQAFINGERIESNYMAEGWKDDTNPKWDWIHYNYRTKRYLPKTLEEFCERHKERLSNYGAFNTVVEHAIAMTALWELIELRDCYNDGWKPDWTNGLNKYGIENHGGFVSKTSTSFTSKILSFKTEELRDKFLTNFRELIETAKELI